METPYIVTATGTDIGKTYLMQQCIQALQQAGQPVHAYKPVVSDFSMENLVDTGQILTALGRELTLENIQAVSPWRYQAPLTPSMAAAAEGREVDFDAIVAFCQQIQTKKAHVLIESVGGVMAPLTHTHTMLDWMVALGYPAILVTGSYLGTLSHTLTAIEVLAHAKVPLAAVVLNETPSSTVPFADTLQTLRQWLKGVPLISLSWGETLDSVELWRIIGRKAPGDVNVKARNPISGTFSVG